MHRIRCNSRACSESGARARLAYWRAPTYNLTRLLLTLAICLFYGTMFLNRGRLPSNGVRPPLCAVFSPTEPLLAQLPRLQRPCGTGMTQGHIMY